MEHKTEPLSYPCSSLNAIVSELSAGSKPSATPTLICELSRRIIASGTRSVLSEARAGRTCACISAPLKVVTLASASSCRSERTDGAATLGAWLWRWSDSGCGARRGRCGRACPRLGSALRASRARRRPLGGSAGLASGRGGGRMRLRGRGGSSVHRWRGVRDSDSAR
jgi:hypothetical protein